ncbi:alpha/beta fold hydrolase [Pseudonocardia acidicola]|uniref:Alpha/beta hydrolase n=1 Tax=Pseudonocardia acidicola TaxID=2724939 RepID=A0ABX1S5Z5_9PSEU|nr:alpha/beta hydrolase [Pseudonocardia acidicola]NMH97000.1 alpha/beta hydrolase [Pseudonocardia acidicola]
MSTYVLVHGAWGGSYGFRKLRPLLRAAGHEVFTPSLTGIGERSHLTSPQVSLSTHILDVVNTIRYEDLDDIVLLGFSYGGMVVTGALEHIGDRVRDLVYLDAFVPGDGDSVSTLRGGGSPAGTELGAPWLIPPLEREYDNPEQAAFSRPRRTAQPIRTFTEPVRLAKPLEDLPLRLTYIRATADPDGAAFEAPAQHARTSPAWNYHEIATSHLVAENRPQELAALLLTLDP